MTATARWAPPTAGIAAAAIAVGLGELSAAIIAPQSSPLTVVGATLIQLAPPWGVDAAIALFGSADKVALAIGIIVVLLVVAAGLGVLEHRRAPLGAVIAAAISALIFLGFLLNAAFQPAIIAVVVVYVLILLGFAIWGRHRLVLSPEEEYALSGGLHGDPQKEGYDAMEGEMFDGKK